MVLANLFKEDELINYGNFAIPLKPPNATFASKVAIFTRVHRAITMQQAGKW